jgi:hypothetical protein
VILKNLFLVWIQLLVVELYFGVIETGIANTGDPVEIIGMGAEN